MPGTASQRQINPRDKRVVHQRRQTSKIRQEKYKEKKTCQHKSKTQSSTGISWSGWRCSRGCRRSS
ncbi:hypothetical protein E2C01_071770 [Portunus trituberculatus]|uniref:Uncharacterized protein n=1 Tax=Portunus trituberculatus TaxID=210409 RepID=A0A5B7I8W0_PORTR|nr:hypothetical protein [Portunus trituberculatus]